MGLRTGLHALARFRGELLRKHGLPLYSLETFTPLREFDLIGFSLQYEVCYTNILTMLDLGGIPLHSKDRTLDHPLVIAGGPGAQNPEVLAPFVDLFVIGDGEESLPWVMESWMTLEGTGRQIARKTCSPRLVGSTDLGLRPDVLRAGIPRRRHHRRHEPHPQPTCRARSWPAPSTQDFDAIPLPTRPVVPFVETPHDRIAIEIMRGCPWQCRFCQSTVIKRPLRVRSVETIVQAALESYRNTGHNEISLLSLSTSDYPYFEELVKRMHEVFTPLGVNISLPSLRVNHQLQIAAEADEGRAQGRPDAGPGSGPRRHARADPQEDQERRPVRRLPRGVQERLAAGQALFPVRPAGRTRRSTSTASWTWPRRSRASARR